MGGCLSNPGERKWKPGLRKCLYTWREDGFERDLEIAPIGYCVRDRGVKDMSNFLYGGMQKFFFCMACMEVDSGSAIFLNIPT